MRFPRLAGISAVVLLGGVLLVTGRAPDSGSGSPSASRPGTGAAPGGRGGGAPAVKTGTLEELAAMTTCDPEVQVDADELRQGFCTTPGGRYVLTTFGTAESQRDWLREAKPYGGSYLVGRKWIAVGEPGVLGGLRATLGGDLESGTRHGSGHGGG